MHGGQEPCAAGLADELFVCRCDLTARAAAQQWNLESEILLVKA